MNALVSAGFDKDQSRRQEIRGVSNGPNIFSAAARNDLAALDKASRDHEQSIKRKTVRLLQGKSSKKSHSGKENVNEGNRDAYDERSSLRSGGSMARDDFSFGPDELTMATICPREKNKKLKVNNMAPSRSRKSSKSTMPKQGETLGLNQLLATVERSPELGRMLVNRYVLIVVSSVIHQNLD